MTPGEEREIAADLGGLAALVEEHEMPDSWRCVAWKANGGYAGQTNENAHRERLWLSPACLDTSALTATQGVLL